MGEDLNLNSVEMTGTMSNDKWGQMSLVFESCLPGRSSWIWVVLERL